MVASREGPGLFHAFGLAGTANQLEALGGLLGGPGAKAAHRALDGMSQKTHGRCVPARDRSAEVVHPGRARRQEDVHQFG